ncbi:phosphoribosylformylglycinamidine cyclo-ligase [Synechococcus sp. PCC 7502]|uniref:phosphoribosylformylglycinamidine cyclo-ligase n=1 Tax=Synechococcus sp. PCC 7502 TaxID=1173263 RepID=UPI00029FD844|nr:phosphoribosylformylglycinamidine cyclo-ligase [Synechococcus sp. PCC 7502]AFY72395.1 phosphoribosylformylglycinamidine cyclo-ligase [Synechococcus sp. PCC 7502]
MDYRESGVDIQVGRNFVEGIRDLVSQTRRPGMLGDLGGFGGLFELPSGYQQPVLVSGTDGVGTKLKIAQACDRHDTVGIDLVAMCVNDILTSGAEPLFFLDYIATGKLKPEQLTEVIKGISLGCQSAGCGLLGGETAEMPGFYGAGEYDLAGFAVGVVEKSLLLNGTQVKDGDAIVGLASSGLHSNGFSLVRKIIADKGFNWSDRPFKNLDKDGDLVDQTLGEICLTPTQIYVKPVLSALKSSLKIHGLAHITGGGIPENLPRCLGQGQVMEILPQSWEIPQIFQWLAEQGQVNQADMFDTFNMGIGMAVVIDPDDLEQTLAHFTSYDIKSWHIGWVRTSLFPSAPKSI